MLNLQPPVRFTYSAQSIKPARPGFWPEVVFAIKITHEPLHLLLENSKKILWVGNPDPISSGEVDTPLVVSSHPTPHPYSCWSSLTLFPVLYALFSCVTICSLHCIVLIKAGLLRSSSVQACVRTSLM